MRTPLQELQENWKDIIGYEGFYQVSDFGRIKSKYFGKEKIITQTIANNGYYMVGLHKHNKQHTKTVHRLVWEAFYGKTNLEIDHIAEGNKLDNRLCNLQLATGRENTSKYHLSRKKTSKYTGVSWHKVRKKWQANTRINGKYKYLGLFINEIDAYSAYQKYNAEIPPTT